MKCTNSQIGKSLISAIKKSGISIAKIAKKSGVKERTIMNWVYANSIPSIENAEKIFNALGYEIKIEKK